MGPTLRLSRVALTVFTAWATLLVASSLVPSDEVYYRLEGVFSRIEPLGAATRQIRSFPITMTSLVFEPFGGRSLEVEGVSIDLGYAVNPTHHVQKRGFASPMLESDRSYLVYLPPGYEESEEEYPSLYLLHGMGRDPGWWTEVARMDRIVTAMIASGRIEPLIMIMPDGNLVEGNVTTTSLYDDRCETGLDLLARALKVVADIFKGIRAYDVSCDADFERHIVEEVVAEVDSRYRTNGERYIGGFSLGGRGALQLTLLNDGVFDGAFGLSGNYDFLRRALRRGDVDVAGDVRLFLASGDNDQRGVYGRLSTDIFHRELERQGIEHLYCIYDGTHSNMSWVPAMPEALQYLLAAGDTAQESVCGHR